MKLKVVHVLMSLLPGGAERLLADALPLFDHSSFDVKLLALGVDGPIGDELRSSGIEVKTLGGSKSKPKFILDFISYLRNERPDILHTHLYWPGALGRVIGKALGIKTIISHEHNTSEWLSPARIALETPTWRFADLVLSVSNSVDSSRSARMPQSVRREIMANGIRMDDIPYPADRAAIRAELGLPTDSPVIGWVGRVVDEIKNVSAILNAAVELEMDRPNLRWAIVGDGPDRAKLETKARELGLENIVKWVGERKDARRLYGAFDIFVLPSNHEGMPMVVMEAMAAGLPVVASDAGGIPDMIVDGINGFVFDRSHPNAFSTLIGKIVDDRGLMERMGKASREWALAKYDIRVFVNRLEKIYRELASAKAGQ